MYVNLVIASLGAGGAERNIIDLAHALVKAGHRVTLITYESDTQDSFYALDAAIERVSLNLFSKKGASRWNRVFSIFKRVYILRQCLKKLNPDRVISFVEITNITVLLAAWGLNKKIIVCERTHPQFYSIPLMYRMLRQLMYPTAYKIIVQTASVRDFFPTFLHPKIVIIPNVIRSLIQVSETHIQLAVTTIVSVGRLCPKKGFDTLIEAFSKIKPYYPQLSLTIYGEGDYRAALEKKISELQLNEAISLPGTVKDIEIHLMSAHLFVLPSHYEGFPNALCEAMGMGLPVAASCCVGNKDVIQDGIDGMLFPIGDSEALATLLNHLIRHPTLRGQLAENAKAILHRYSAKEIMTKWETCLL